MERLVDNSNGHDHYEMTKISEYIWQAIVPTSATNITFNRLSPNGQTQWNSFSAGGRGTNNAYYADGAEYGHWGTVEIEEKEDYFHAGDTIYLDVSEFTDWKKDGAILYVNFSDVSKQNNGGKDISINGNVANINPKIVSDEVEKDVYKYVVSEEDEGKDILRFWRGNATTLWNCSITLSYEEYIEGNNSIKINGWNDGSLSYYIEYIDLPDGKIEKDYIEKAIYTKLLLDGKSIDDVRLSDDFDNDGLTLIQEYDYDTNPFSIDTDEDGLNDYEEINNYKTSPINSDTDGDGLSDWTEVSNGLNPLKKDTDGDGIEDNDEVVTQSVRLDKIYKYTLSEVDTLPTVELTGSGDYSRQIYAQAIEYDETILDIECLVGTPFDFVHDEELSFESGKLTFEISDNILDEYAIEDLVIAWYNEEENVLELLETEHDTVNSKISANVEHFSIYMVVSASKYFYNIGRGNNESVLESGMADIVFVVDTTGSMDYAISNVKANIENFVSMLERNKVDARFGLVEYKDIYADGYNSTKSHGWYTDVEKLKQGLSSFDISGGGDTPESLVDALECARKMNYRTGVGKYIIVITDANYKEGSASSYYATMSGEIQNLKSNGFSISVVTESKYYSIYEDLTSDTDGVLTNINENFSSAFLPIVVNIGVDTNSGRWVRLSNGMVVKLDADPSIGDIDVDTDGDGVPDLIELGKEVTILVYNPLTRKHESYKTWTFYSNPTKADTDGDGVSDLYDINPCKYDITAEINENETIKFNTGKVWNYLECSLEDYFDNFLVYRGLNSYAENPIDFTSFTRIMEKVFENEEYSFTKEELSIIGLYDNDGSKLYMDKSTRTVREAVFKSIVGREPTYYQRKGIFSSTSWEEVPYGTESSFWRGSVITEADLNFSTGIYSFFDTFDIHVVMEIIGIVTIVLISVAIVEAVPVVISNMQALAYYIRNFGIVQGCGMYMTLGAEGLPNGVISWLQADMADGDSSLDDFVEKGGAGTYIPPVGGGGATATINANGKAINFGHGGRHLEGFGLDVNKVNQALADEVSKLNLGLHQFHKGQIIVDGIKIEYTSYVFSNNAINVGTYYPIGK